METSTMTVRLPNEIKRRLDKLAKATDRSKSWLAADAIRAYIEIQEWQIQEIKAGLEEADAGNFASDEEVRAVVKKWSSDAS